MLYLPSAFTVILLFSWTLSSVQAQEAVTARVTPGTDEVSRPDLEEITVFGRATRLLGTAGSASEGAVGGADLTVRPLLRVAELLEVVPGMIAAQHSGSGKANQYFLRGFNLDHGTDFTTYVDGVPINLRSHGHGQGYLDVNGILPEVIEQVDYRKGPYHPDIADFSLAGAALMQTVDQVDPYAGVEAGEYGWRRLSAGGSTSIGNGTLLMAGQWKSYDGPWELDEDLQHQSVWGKYLVPLDAAEFRISLWGYHAKWNPSEQIPERVIGTTVCEDEFCALDPSAEGNTMRWIGLASLEADDWSANAWFQYYNWNMLSNPTYDFQINQFDRRWTFGGRLEHYFTVADNLDLSLGTELRYDDIGNVGVEHTDSARFVAPISRHAIEEGSAALYAGVKWSPLDRLRLTGGLRADTYHFDVVAKAPGLDSGTKTASQVSPKLAAAYLLTDTIEVYANWGIGFHSNDARGVVNPVTPIVGLSEGEGYETGARFEQGEFRLTATWWWLNLDSELKFVGDSNSVEPGAATRRHGYEIVGFWRPYDWLALDAVWTGSHARFEDSPGAEFVSGGIENAGELGISAIREQWEASLRVRHLGEYPLVEDNSLRADAETIVNLRAAWKFEHIMLYGELLNILDDNGKDIVYYYASNVAGFDPPGIQVDGRVSRAVEPRTLRVGIKYQF